MTVAYLALGSNLGDRLAELRAAAAALDGDRVRVAARSPVFETVAVAAEAQPPYLNAALRVETTLSARALLDRCLAVEAARGRVRPAGMKHAPRVLDVDLLLYGDAVIDEAGLVVPHPRLPERPFVRVPLARVAAPGLCHPLTGAPLDRADDHPDVVLLAERL